MMGTPAGVTGARVRAIVAPKSAAAHPRRPVGCLSDQEPEEESGEEGVEAQTIRVADQVPREHAQGGAADPHRIIRRQ